MVFSCCVYKCKSVSSSSSGIIFYSFPTDKDLKAQWLGAIGRPNFKPKPHMMVCSKHFMPDDLETGLKRLKSLVVPSVDIDMPPHEEAFDNPISDTDSPADQPTLVGSNSNQDDQTKNPTSNPPRTSSKNLRVVIEPSEDGKNHMARLVYVSGNTPGTKKPISGNLGKIIPKISPSISPTINRLKDSTSSEQKQKEFSAKEDYFQSLKLNPNEKLPEAEMETVDDLSNFENDSASISDSDCSFDDEILDSEDKLLLNSSCSPEPVSGDIRSIPSGEDVCISSNSERKEAELKISSNEEKDDTEINVNSNVGLKRKRSGDVTEQSENVQKKIQKSSSSAEDVKETNDSTKFKSALLTVNLAKPVPINNSDSTVNSKASSSNAISVTNKYGDPYVLLAPLSGDPPLTCYVMSSGTNLNHYVATTATSSLTATPSVPSTPLMPASGLLVTAVTSADIQVKKPIKSDNIQPKASLTTQEHKATPNELYLKGCISNIEKKYNHIIDTLKSKMVQRRRSVKSLWQKCRRLTKSLDNSKSELSKTRKNLNSLESQSVTWNNTNMSDLGKLIYNLHTCKGKKNKAHQTVAVPPEVRGFVISLFLTSPRAYHIVRDCFNSLPHPKTIARWLSGDKTEENSARIPPTKEVSLEETFTRVIEAVKADTSLKNVKKSLKPTVSNESKVLPKEVDKVPCKKPVFKVVPVKNKPGLNNSETTSKLNAVYTSESNSKSSSLFNVQTLVEPSTVFNVVNVNEPNVNQTFQTLTIPASESNVDDTTVPSAKHDVNSTSESYTAEGLEPSENYSDEGVTEPNTVYSSMTLNVEDVNEQTVFNVEGLSKEQAVYFVMDEDGNMTGQLCNPADIVFCSEGMIDDEIDLTQVPQHEVVIE